MKVSSELSKPYLIERDERQGCLISPVMFNIYTEAMLKKTLRSLEDEVKVKRVLIKAVRLWRINP